MSETVSFVQIVIAVTPQGALLYGLTTSGVVYEYNFSRHPKADPSRPNPTFNKHQEMSP